MWFLYITVIFLSARKMKQNNNNNNKNKFVCTAVTKDDAMEVEGTKPNDQLVREINNLNELLLQNKETKGTTEEEVSITYLSSSLHLM